MGPGDGIRSTTNIQPVIPFGSSEDWDHISRTILPVIDQEGLAPAGDSPDKFGLGETVQSFFFSPKESSPIWGIGPVFLIPTATDPLLGSQELGLGPTAVALKQEGPWTFGALTNHIWGVAGDKNRQHGSRNWPKSPESHQWRAQRHWQNRSRHGQSSQW